MIGAAAICIVTGSDVTCTATDEERCNNGPFAGVIATRRHASAIKLNFLPLSNAAAGLVPKSQYRCRSPSSVSVPRAFLHHEIVTP